tara:strand:+ start:753 stop:929 length:177 start_codon:yes stop_codon:yes gene_type:complete
MENNKHSLSNQIIELQEKMIEGLQDEISILRNLKEVYEVAILGLVFVALVGVLTNIFI